MREKNIFRFKQFAIRQEQAAMKVGTDGVLLGAWANIANAKRILDIGTGTGLIALMLAQRTSAATKIEAIEIEQHAYEEACFNIAQSPWDERITVHHQSVQEFSSQPYDLIICNPPFFKNSLKPPDEKRLVARHAEGLPIEALAKHCKRLINNDGSISLIIPKQNEKETISCFIENGLYCNHITYVHTTAHKPSERCLLHLTTVEKSKTMDVLVLLDENLEKTIAYRQLTQDYYLK